MGIDDTLDAMTKSSEKALSPIDAVRTLKSYIDIQHFVEFIASATPNEIELISRCIQAIKQGNNSCSAHLVAFSHSIDEMLHAGGWTKEELDNVASLQADLVKSALLESLTLKAGQTIMAAAIAEIRGDNTLTYSQMSKKLVDAEASQAAIDEKTGVASKKKALATKKEEEKDDKKGDDNDKEQPSWKRGNR